MYSETYLLYSYYNLSHLCNFITFEDVLIKQRLPYDFIKI